METDKPKRAVSKRKFHHLQKKKGKTALDLIRTERVELPDDMKIKGYPTAKDYKLFKFSMAMMDPL